MLMTRKGTQFHVSHVPLFHKPTKVLEIRAYLVTEYAKLKHHFPPGVFAVKRLQRRDPFLQDVPHASLKALAHDGRVYHQASSLRARG